MIYMGMTASVMYCLANVLVSNALDIWSHEYTTDQMKHYQIGINCHEYTIKPMWVMWAKISCLEMRIMLPLGRED